MSTPGQAVAGVMFLQGKRYYKPGSIKEGVLDRKFF